jgi:cytochrome c-type biogenesis protein CcmE
MTPRARRLLTTAALLGCSVAAVVLVTNAFRSNLVFFYSPSDIVAGQAPRDRAFRLGGLVEAGSVQRQADGVTVRFVVTDRVRRIPVAYRGILPDLFREGKGVVTQGSLDGAGLFVAREVLAKHDENYMPPEAADALDRAHRQQLQAAAEAGTVGR